MVGISAGTYRSKAQARERPTSRRHRPPEAGERRGAAVTGDADPAKDHPSDSQSAGSRPPCSGQSALAALSGQAVPSPLRINHRSIAHLRVIPRSGVHDEYHSPDRSQGLMDPADEEAVEASARSGAWEKPANSAPAEAPRNYSRLWKAIRTLARAGGLRDHIVPWGPRSSPLGTGAAPASGSIAAGNRLDADIGCGLPVGRRLVGTPPRAAGGRTAQPRDGFRACGRGGRRRRG